MRRVLKNSELSWKLKDVNKFIFNIQDNQRKVFEAIIRNIKNAFKFVKNFIKTAGKIASKLFPNFAKGATKLFQKERD